MRPIRLVLFAAVAVEAAVQVVLSQSDTGFELPVQLIGFPVIIFAVKLSNFVKKLAYAVNPSTYQERAKRAAFPDDADVTEVENRLVAEMGEKVCVYERVCSDYATRANTFGRKKDAKGGVLDWDKVFERYKREPGDNKKFYLLSVFLGEIVASPELCYQLARRGRSCRI